MIQVTRGIGMSDEDAFLARIAATPADDVARLVYADWLEERGDAESAAKAEYLRQTCQLLAPGSTKSWRAIRRRLQQIAAMLDTGVVGHCEPDAGRELCREAG